MSGQEESGLQRLKHDLDEADWPSPELLARYATDPNGMPEAEKRQVERALAASRILADELATLRGFDFSQLDDDRRGAGVPVGARAVGLPREGASTWLDRLRARFLPRPRALAALTALLALATWFALSDRPGAPTGAPDAPAPQLAESAAPIAPTEPAPHDVADPETPSPRPAPDPSRIAAVDPPGSAPGSALPRPSTHEDDIRPETRPGSAPSPSPDSPPSPARADEGEREVLLAMAMPDYRPAYGLEPQPGADWIVRGADAEAANTIVILAPDHVARACSASPRLHWSLDRMPTRATLYLTILDADDEPIVLDRPIAPPARAGLQRLDLAALTVTLPEGRSLRWSIVLREDGTAAPAAFDFGWLRVQPPDATQAARLAGADDGSRAAAYAELGCYSEALEAALVARANHPGDPAPEGAIAQLAGAAGFDAQLAGE